MFTIFMGFKVMSDYFQEILLATVFFIHMSLNTDTVRHAARVQNKVLFCITLLSVSVMLKRTPLAALDWSLVALIKVNACLFNVQFNTCASKQHICYIQKSLFNVFEAGYLVPTLLINTESNLRWGTEAKIMVSRCCLTLLKPGNIILSWWWIGLKKW